MRTTIYTDLKVTEGMVTAVTNADANLTAVDRKGYEEVMFHVSLGNSADTLSGSNYIELEVEESDDNSTFTDVANADLVRYVTGNNTGTFGVINAPTEDSTSFQTAYRGNSRYVRIVLSFTGTHSTGTPIHACYFQKAKESPTVSVTTQ